MRNLVLMAFALLFLVTAAPSGVHAQSATPPGFEDLAEKLLPTVVNVSTTAKIKQGAVQGLPDLPQFPQGSPFEDFFKDFYDRYRNQQPDTEQKVSSLGSGFIIDGKKGYIVTNNHVIKDADEIKVILHDDTTLDATLVGSDDKTDVALLKVQVKKPLPEANWGDSDAARVGSWVLAIGNPFGLGGTVTAGIVSARQRDINAGPYDDFIQTDASINRGNSGGPMFNLKGEVIGINTAIFSPSGGSVGIGFSVPANIAKGVVEQLIKYGKTRRGWLGVRIQQVDDEIAEGLGLPKSEGALVSSVTPDSPAAKAGIEAEDVILAFNGQHIDKMKSLPRLVADTEVGSKVDVLLWRKGSQKTVAVTLGQLETAEEKGLIESADAGKTGAPAEPKADMIDELGLGLSVLNDKLRENYGVPKTTQGLLVTKVERGSVASEKGLSEGDVVMRVDQKDVASVDDVRARVASALKSGRSAVLLFVERKGDRRFVALKIKK